LFEDSTLFLVNAADDLRLEFALLKIRLSDNLKPNQEIKLTSMA